MLIVTRKVNVETNANASEGFIAIYNITPKVLQQTEISYVANGILTVFLPGTTAAVGTIEYEAGLLNDFKKIWSQIVPKDFVYTHKFLWEQNNAYSHVRASMMGASLTIPLVNKRLTLGQYQQIILVEFDNRARNRQVILQFMGEKSTGE
ncbi:MAG: secondary thiamine-phosphate synthase enzyme YjbQ [Dehalococcoidales bacterium]